MRLDELNYVLVDDVVDWRNGCRESLRTSGITSTDTQLRFYNSLKNRSDIKYYSILEEKDSYEEGGNKNNIIGVGGLVNIEWPNRIAEIAVLLNPVFRGQGKGKDAVNLILDEAFDNMGITTVYGECYSCSPALDFWSDMAKKEKWYTTVLPKRKIWNGKMYDSLYFSIDAEPMGKYARLVL